MIREGDVSAPGGLILLTGATGYIGGRLLRALERAGCRVRCLARRPEHVRDRVAKTTHVVAGDVLEYETLLRGIAAAAHRNAPPPDAGPAGRAARPAAAGNSPSSGGV